MMTKLKYSLLLAIMPLLCISCYEDKGNYTYSEKEVVTITLPDNLKVMSRAEYINFDPAIVSSLNGDIAADNKNYTFGCKINYQYYNSKTGETENWTDIDSAKTKTVNYFAKLPAGTYKIMYDVTNVGTGVTTSILGNVSLLSATSEGWMVLNNVGTENRVRLDMISTDSKGNMVTARDVMGDKAPALYNGTQVMINPSKFWNGEGLFLMSKSGGYRLNVSTLQTTETDNMKLTDFILSTTPGQPVSMIIVNKGGTSGPLSRVCVTDVGNAYALTSNASGASFEDPINTNTRGTAPTYSVSPMIGTSMARPGNSSCVLLYDNTNKRFMGWNYGATDNHITFALNDPDGVSKKFSYKTGMDLVAMKSTRYSDGLVYSVLQDAQKLRHIYGINLSGSQFTQESIYENITAEHFNDASDYAFHSQYPFMFYSYGNKVYCYNLGTGAVSDVLTLDAGETVTMLKFNLFVNMQLSDLADHSDEFLAKQYQLIVGSSTSASDGGFVRFYAIDNTGKMTKKEEYKGFGKVVDVTYRERRK